MTISRPRSCLLSHSIKRNTLIPAKRYFIVYANIHALRNTEVQVAVRPFVIATNIAIPSGSDRNITLLTQTNCIGILPLWNIPRTTSLRNQVPMFIQSRLLATSVNAISAYWIIMRTRRISYFRAFGAVSQKTTVEDAGGKRVRLIGCTIYEVPAKQRNFARQLIAANQVRQLLDSDDVYCGKPIVIEGLFRKFN